MVAPRNRSICLLTDILRLNDLASVYLRWAWSHYTTPTQATDTQRPARTDFDDQQGLSDRADGVGHYAGDVAAFHVGVEQQPAQKQVAGSGLIWPSSFRACGQPEIFAARSALDRATVRLSRTKSCGRC